MDSLFQDIRYAVRVLIRAPGFAAVALLALALSIGANTAIFTVVNAVLLRPLRYYDPGRLVVIRERRAQQGFEKTVVAPGEFLEWSKASDLFDQVAAVAYPSVALSAGAEPEQVDGLNVSAALFPMLGIRPAVGRPFSADEDRPGSNVALISHRLWQRRFGADPAIVGTALRLNAESVTVIGVLPQSFSFGGDSDIVAPIGFNAAATTEFGSHYLDVFARLRPGVSRERAEVELSDRLRRSQRQLFHAVGVTLVPLHEELVGDVRSSMLMLFAAVGFVLLIACANIANLLLARSTARQKELAVRAALGAGRGRLARQLLTESVILAVLGGSLGLVLALWGVDLLVSLSPEGLPLRADIDIDIRVLAFTFFVAVGVGLLFGAAPAWHVSRSDMNATLRDEGRSGGLGRRRRALGIFVMSEIALALMLLVGAALLFESFRRLSAVDPGFDPSNLFTLEIALPEAKYTGPPEREAFYRSLLAVTQGRPGIKAAGIVNMLPLSGNNSSGSITIEGRPLPSAADRPNANIRQVSPDYFRAMGMTLLRGRSFSDRDDPSAPLVAVINTTMARRFWPNEDPIGRRFKIGRAESQQPWLTVVGLVNDVRHLGLRAPPRQELYRPYLQQPGRQMVLAVRTAGDPAAALALVRQEVRKLDADLPVSIRPMTDLTGDSLAPERFSALLVAIFSCAAILLAGAGIYGVMAYTVSQRTREIGVRIALGARERDVLRLVLAGGLRLVAAGLTCGIAGSLLVTRAIESLLFGVSPTDPATLAATSVLLGAIAVLASYLPARRAVEVDPIVALRSE